MIENLVTFTLLGLVFVGIPLYLVAKWRERRRQQASGQTATARPVLTYEQHQQIVQNIPQLLFIIGGANFLFTIVVRFNVLTFPASAIDLAVSAIYLGLGLATQRRSKTALLAAILFFVSERGYGILLSTTRLGWSWTSCISLGFGLFGAMMLWQGFQSLRYLDKVTSLPQSDPKQP
jgi:hypothetical protein